MFRIDKKFRKNKARLGMLNTKHGQLKTPFFMPDATRGSVRGVSNTEMAILGVPAMVVNTFHLYLQPGMKLIKKLDGIHNFMGWDRPLLSDSGGYQVFSLAHKNGMGKITDKGVEFKSPIDGSFHMLTPEKSIQIQFDLGVDMMVALDDCPPNYFSREDLEKSVDRTIRWAKRCWVEYSKQLIKRKINEKDRPKIFAVVQGGEYLDLRKKCFDGLFELDFSARGGPASGWDGYGFGARPVDKDGKFLGEVLQYTADLIPEDKLRFALGIGTPEDIVRCFHMGWDMFDCVVPTREARHGRLYNFKFQIPNFKSISNDEISKFYDVININNSKFKTDANPIDKSCDCELCQNYSASYLHYLFKIKEPLGAKLSTIHNLRFYTRQIL